MKYLYEPTKRKRARLLQTAEEAVEYFGPFWCDECDTDVHAVIEFGDCPWYVCRQCVIRALKLFPEA